MTAEQENKLSMAKATQKVLNDNSSIVSTVPAFVTAATDLDNEIDTIDGIVQVQVKKVTGKATDKEGSAENAVNLALELIGPARSYASDQNNNDLYESLNYTKSGLLRLRDNILFNTLTTIRDIVQSNIAALAPYGLLPANVTALTSAIGGYGVLMSAPRDAISIRAAATKALVERFKNLDKILDRVDGFVEGKKSSEPNFYKICKSARIIVNLNGKGATITVSGRVVHDVGGVSTGLADVDIVILETGESGTSGPDGSFSIKSKGKGDATIEFTHPGFANRDASINLKGDIEMGEVVMTV